MKLMENFVVTVGSDKDTFIKVWDTNGKQIHQVNTNEVQHNCSFINERFVLLSGWVITNIIFQVPDVKMTEFKMTKDKEFTKLQKVLQIPHKSFFIFVSEGNERAVTISNNDHLMKIWNIGVRFDLKEEAHLIKTFSDSDMEAIFNKKDCKLKAGACVLEPITNKWISAVAIQGDVVIFDHEWNVIEKLENVAAEHTEVDELRF